MNHTERAEGTLLVLILLVVGAAAGWASFSHVHAWTIANRPAGTPEAFGWVNACVSELVPVASLLEIRRRRAGVPTGYPLALLVGAACLSLAAQLAVAKPGVSGWLVSWSSRWPCTSPSPSHPPQAVRRKRSPRGLIDSTSAMSIKPSGNSPGLIRPPATAGQVPESSARRVCGSP